LPVIRHNSSPVIAQTRRAENNLVDPATALTGIGIEKPIKTTAGLHGGQQHIALCIKESISPAGTRVATNSGGAFVTMMKTSDTRPRYDAPSPYAARSLFWGLLLESTVDTCWFVGKGFAQLLHDPGASRMACNVEVKNTPPIVADYEENIKHPKRHSRY
jgi:hypothetical protein